MKPLISLSILSTNFCGLAQELETVSNADWLHVDVMDGHFVPNITIGVPVVESLRKTTDMFLDVHLMIDKPVRFVEAFAKAGADMLTFHLEADHPTGIRSAVDLATQLGVKKGVALRPITKAEAVVPYLKDIDMVLVMTVEPGFGGQKFMDDQLDTIRAVRALIDKHNPACRLAVDGGVYSHTAPAALQAGADVLVAGTAVFRRSDRDNAIEELRGALHA